MSRKDFFVLGPIALLSSFLIFLVLWKGQWKNLEKNGSVSKLQPTSMQSPLDTNSGDAPTLSRQFDEPIADFKTRITKKPFGLKISPQNSPVKPERFSGYHTGVDVEYEDVVTDVPVYAIADGYVMISKEANGYGGVFLLSFELDGSRHTAIYGHIRPVSLPQAGQNFKRGEQIALLGTNKSIETDGERRHLHFGILVDNGTDLRGYVATKSELSGWIDPLTLY